MHESSSSESSLNLVSTEISNFQNRRRRRSSIFNPNELACEVLEKDPYPEEYRQRLQRECEIWSEVMDNAVTLCTQLNMKSKQQHSVNFNRNDLDAAQGEVLDETERCYTDYLKKVNDFMSMINLHSELEDTLLYKNARQKHTIISKITSVDDYLRNPIKENKL